MRIEYTNRATTDLRKVSAGSRAFGEEVAREVEIRISEIIVRIAEYPEGAPRVAQRAGMHVVPLVRYPHKIFYRVLSDRIRIVHIRSTSRQPWKGR